MFTVTAYISQGKDLKANEPFIQVESSDGTSRETGRGKHTTQAGITTFGARCEFAVDAAKTLPSSLTFRLREYSRFFKAKELGAVAVALPATAFVRDADAKQKPVPCQYLTLAGGVGLLQVEVAVEYTAGAADPQRLRYKSAIGLMSLRVTQVTLAKADFSSVIPGIFRGETKYFLEIAHGLVKYNTRPQPKAASGNTVAFNEDIRFWVHDDTKDYEVQLALFEQSGSSEAKQLASAFVSTQELITADEHSDGNVAVKLSNRKAVGVTDRDGRGLAAEGSVDLDVGGAEREAHVVPKYAVKAEVESRFIDGLWDHFDLDGNGTLSDIEVAAMMDTIRFPMSGPQLTAFMQTVDADFDGELTRDEFTLLFNSAQFQSNPMSSNLLSYILDGKEGLDHMVSGISDRITMKTDKHRMSVAAVSTGAGEDEDDMGLIVFDRATGMLLHENIPSYIKIALKSMYRTGFGQKLTETSKVRSMLVAQSRAEGLKMDHPDSKAKIPPFIDLHQLDVTEMKLPVDAFPHFNAFFYRELKDGARPIAAPLDNRVAVSCADSRMTVFPNILDSTVVWIKGSEFTVEKLLGPRSDLASQFLGASLVIARLAPQDYHRFHFPVSGTVKSITAITGTLYTVNPIAVRQPVNVYTENIRNIMELDTAEFGTVVMIPVGATMVGSVNILPQYKTPGAKFIKGADAGYFAFGGSTVLLLFRAGSLALDADLVESSKKPVEVLVRVGMQIGTATK